MMNTYSKAERLTSNHEAYPQNAQNSGNYVYDSQIICELRPSVDIAWHRHIERSMIVRCSTGLLELKTQKSGASPTSKQVHGIALVDEMETQQKSINKLQIYKSQGQGNWKTGGGSRAQ